MGKARIIFKGGGEVVFDADKITVRSSNNELTSLLWEPAKNGPTYARLSDVVFVGWEET